MRTNQGRDWQSGVMGDTASTGTGAFAPANWMGVTEDPTAPDPADTELFGEITSGTLVRAQATYAHTTGATSYTLTRNLTADAEVTIHKIGIFTAPAGGVMVFTALLNREAVMVPGDQVQITHSVFL